jgi:hypothetical protein
VSVSGRSRRAIAIAQESKDRAGGFVMRRIWLLLLVPYAGLLWVPLYNKRLPDLFGFPFFYWYQLLFVPITGLLIYIVYRKTPDDR